MTTKPQRRKFSVMIVNSMKKSPMAFTAAVLVAVIAMHSYILAQVQKSPEQWNILGNEVLRGVIYIGVILSSIGLINAVLSKSVVAVISMALSIFIWVTYSRFFSEKVQAAGVDWKRSFVKTWSILSVAVNSVGLIGLALHYKKHA